MWGLKPRAIVAGLESNTQDAVVAGGGRLWRSGNGNPGSDFGGMGTKTRGAIGNEYLGCDFGGILNGHPGRDWKRKPRERFWRYGNENPGRDCGGVSNGHSERDFGRVGTNIAG